MDNKLENRLYKKYKFLKKKIMPEINCEDGWYPLINDMCNQLKNSDQLPEDFVITKIFDKFGDMMVYSKKGNNTTRFIIESACDESMSICDACGNNKDEELCPKCTTSVVNYFEKGDKEDED
jgi:hypothetical protein